MPLRLGDGTTISEVRLGDGTVISEIRKGDGTVIYTSGGGGGGTTLEDWEHNDIAANYDEDTSAFTTQTNTVKEGTYAAEVTSTGSVRISQWSTQTSQGNVYAFWVDASNDLTFLYGTQGTSAPVGSAYGATIKSGAIRLGEWSGGSFQGGDDVQESAYTDPTGWLWAELDWANPTHTLTLFDDKPGNGGSQLQQVTRDDTAYTSGYFAWEGFNESGGLIDTLVENP